MSAPAEPLAAARAAGLRYTTDATPGITRRKRGKDFEYLDPQGRPIADEAELSRIRSLAIPPAYRDVWICPNPKGHLQATGRDARGRKQYRYHKRWREVRDEGKFDRMLAFARALPAIRAAVRRDVAKPGMPREKVLATVVSLLEATAIRIGNEEYARDNDSYGLTTMREDHVSVRGETIRFRFRGKSGREHDIAVQDKRLAKIVRACQEIPGHELFHYVDEDGEPAKVDSQDVNDYLREITGEEFSAKDFRTWEATMGCALELAALRAETKTEAKAHVVAAIKAVAEKLGNTPAVCKKSYIHPAVLDEFVANGALELVEAEVERVKSDHPALRKDEAKVVRFLETVVNRDEQAHLSDLLAKSVRAAKADRKAAKQPPRRSKATPSAG